MWVTERVLPFFNFPIQNSLKIETVCFKKRRERRVREERERGEREERGR